MPKLIYQPLKPFLVTQTFHENIACISTDGKNKVIYCKDPSNPPAGYRGLYKDGRHGALDLLLKHGQEVYATHAGTVYSIDTNEKTGLDVRIEGEKDGIKFRTISEHLLGHQVKKGDTVTVGQLIGWGNNTGYSSGDHLHFQLEIFQNGVWVKADPMEYMEHSFALEILLQLSVIKYLKELLAILLDNSASKLRT